MMYACGPQSHVIYVQASTDVILFAVDRITFKYILMDTAVRATWN